MCSRQACPCLPRTGGWCELYVSLMMSNPGMYLRFYNPEGIGLPSPPSWWKCPSRISSVPEREVERGGEERERQPNTCPPSHWPALHAQAVQTRWPTGTGVRPNRKVSPPPPNDCPSGESLHSLYSLEACVVLPTSSLRPCSRVLLPVLKCSLSQPTDSRNSAQAACLLFQSRVQENLPETNQQMRCPGCLNSNAPRVPCPGPRHAAREKREEVRRQVSVLEFCRF